MKIIFLGIMVAVTGTVYGYSVYPTDVFAFELVPSAREYLVAPSGRKVQIYRNLDMTDQGFLFNIELEITTMQTFLYYIVLHINQDGKILLKSFGDSLYRRSFSEEKLFMPSTKNLEQTFSTTVGKNLIVSYFSGNSDKMILQLIFGDKTYILTFQYQRGLVSIKTESEEFIRVTPRIYEQTVLEFFSKSENNAES